MIISVYGIPRSGKDTFIDKVLNKNNSTFHLKGSERLNELSLDLFGNSFSQLDENKQSQIRIEFTKYAKNLEKKYNLVMVDGHYSFPSDHGYKVVFTKADLELYDAFFYLKRTGEEIFRNFNSDVKKDYSKHLLSCVKSEEWIEFEISNMQKEIECADKDFIVLDSDSLSSDFVFNFKRTSEDIAEQIACSIKEKANGRAVVLSDLDKTVSINDLTNDFIQNSGLDPHLPKVIFKGDYYTSYQFVKFHKFLLSSQNYEESIKYSLGRLELNQHIIEDLLRLKSDCCIIGLTTGMVDAWNIKNKDLKLFEKIYGYGIGAPIVITPLIKKLVAKYLSRDFVVMAIGDSIIDLGMILESQKGYLVSMNKLDKRIIKAHEDGKINKTVFQPTYSTFKYDFVKEEDVKW